MIKMKSNICITFMLLALLTERIDGASRVLSPKTAQEFHYNCTGHGPTYDYNITLNTEQQNQSYIVAESSMPSSLTTNTTGTCVKKIQYPAPNIVVLTKCKTATIYLFEDENPLSKGQFVGGKNYKTYNLSCFVSPAGAKYDVNGSVIEKAQSGTNLKSENPDLLLEMKVTLPNETMPRAKYEIGRKLQLSVIDSSAHQNYLVINMCKATDSGQDSQTITLINGSTIASQIVTQPPATKATAQNAFFQFNAFRFTGSSTVVITCTITEYGDDPKLRKRRRRSADSQGNKERSKSLQASFTVVSNRQASSQIKATVDALLVAVCTVMTLLRMD